MEAGWLWVRIGRGISGCGSNAFFRPGQQDAAPDVPADVAGLIGHGDRKRKHPRAARIDAVTYDSLRPPPPSPRRRMATARFALCTSVAVQAQFCP
jgi:hypothetical protein